MDGSGPRGTDRNTAHGNAVDTTLVMTAVVAIVAVADNDAVDGAWRADRRGAGERLRLHGEDAERHRNSKP
jgi:hypothetical protein